MMRALVMTVLVATVAQVHAEDLTLETVIAATDQAPATRTTAAELAGAEARVDAAGAWNPTTLHVGTNRLTARVVAGIVVPLPILGTLGASRDEADAHASTVRAEGTVARRELRHRAVVAWLELARGDATVATLVTAADQAAALEKIAQGRLEIGVGGQVDVTSAHAAKARADVAVAAARRETDARAAELAGILGWDPLRELHAAGGLPGGTADLEALRQRLAGHPERAAMLDRVAEFEASARRVNVARRPGLAVEVTASYRDPTNDNKTDLFAGLSLELPLFAHLGAQLRAANHDTAAERARLAALDTELAGGLVAAYRRWEAATDRLTGLERDVMPAQEQATKLTEQAYREGARDLATALLAARDLAAVRAETANARIDAATAWIELELATGKDAGAR